ncbi:hypothetical protein PoB_003955400 [Plakobranchus ocellatus]|uniref:Uncharacterized protein n=1 Tax=Plakobranchus ocellatus TaxID=259542 RepID=A0AAV4B3W0_9GAST|nr:hypothetical protein PoB_003955400 [Plakobranchus ocellatus]
MPTKNNVKIRDVDKMVNSPQRFGFQPVHNKVISGFQALRQARAPVAKLEPETECSLHCALDAPFDSEQKIGNGHSVQRAKKVCMFILLLDVVAVAAAAATVAAAVVVVHAIAVAAATYIAVTHLPTFDILKKSNTLSTYLHMPVIAGYYE